MKMETGNEITTINAAKISALTGFKPEEVAIIKNTVAKGTTDSELAYFLSIAKSVSLNPFNKEIWCYKDNKGNVLVFAGRDGFLKRAQESQLWNGMTSFEVCKNDEFEMDVTTATVKHKPNFKDRGEIIGAYAIVRPKGCDLATVEWAEMKVYNKGYNVWKSDPATMIKKVAETHALKKGFGITIIQSEYDYDVKNEIAIPVLHEGKDELETAKQKIINAIDKYVGEDREEIRMTCLQAKKLGTFDMAFAQKTAKILGIEL
jgi:recombination protein RecT